MLLLGVVALFWPGLTLGIFLYAVALFGIVVGILDLIFGLVTIPRNRTWWLNVLSGIVFIGVAAYLLRHTDVALGTFAVIGGSIFIVRGVLETISAGLVGAIQRKPALGHRWYLVGYRRCHHLGLPG